MFTGIGYALLTLASANASSSYKLTMNLSAVCFFVQGFMEYQTPGQNEKDMDKIDMLVGATQE